jgi:hypothetical protein
MELTALSDPKVQWDQQERTELTALSDRKVHWDQQARRERTGLTAQSDRRARRDPSVPPALPVPLALPDRTT